jgi:hypothetical protein
MHHQSLQWRTLVHRRCPSWDGELQQARIHLKQTVPAFVRQGSIRNLLTTPIIYSLVLPFVLLDLWVTGYQSICFPIYGIARVSRRWFFAIDRHKLAYLNSIEKANCMYCSYATGVIGYAREVAARTEQYWCPIRHAGRIRPPHDHYQLFFDYGDAASYRRGLFAMRKRLRP